MRLVRVSALLAAAFAASALLFLARTGERNGSQATLLGELMADHAKYVPEGMPAEIASDDPAQVRSFFQGRVRFSPSVPRLPEARLIGGRLCRLGGEPVQLLFYRRRGLPLSLYVTTLDLPAGKCHARGPRRACAEKKGPLVFILVGEAPEAELRELLRTVRTGDPRSNAPSDATERVPPTDVTDRVPPTAGAAFRRCDRTAHARSWPCSCVARPPPDATERVPPTDVTDRVPPTGRCPRVAGSPIGPDVAKRRCPHAPAWIRRTCGESRNARRRASSGRP